MPPKKAPTSLYEIPVAYGNVNVGDLTARLAVHIDRKQMTLGQADKLCGKRLVGRITAQAGNDNPEQDALPGAESETEMAGVFDVKSMGFNPKSLSTGLSFSIASIDLPTLCTFAKRAGKMFVEAVEDIPADEAGDE
ncbi:MAG TPA: hypothetical protein VM597_02695 [Gemmataceae bacterium]|nr:hypothetical protein [Gemmataceae bacterium]